MEPMLLLRVEKLPQGADWSYEIKLDGYRALAIKSGGKVQLRSRNDNDFTERYSLISTALRSMPNETVMEGEVAALDEDGRPSLNLLQNYGSADALLSTFTLATDVGPRPRKMSACRSPIALCRWICAA